MRRFFLNVKPTGVLYLELTSTGGPGGMFEDVSVVLFILCVRRA